MDLPQVLVVNGVDEYHNRAAQLIGLVMDVCTERALEMGTVADAVKPMLDPLRKLSIELVKMNLVLARGDEERQRAIFRELLDHMGPIFRDLNLSVYLDGEALIVSEKE